MSNLEKPISTKAATRPVRTLPVTIIGMAIFLSALSSLVFLWISSADDIYLELILMFPMAIFAAIGLAVWWRWRGWRIYLGVLAALLLAGFSCTLAYILYSALASGADALTLPSLIANLLGILSGIGVLWAIRKERRLAP